MLKSEGEIDAAEIVRAPLNSDKKSETGPFDIIGDIHGCYDELCELLEKLGYGVDAGGYTAVPPNGRKTVFLGDLCDRGEKNTEVLRLAMNMANSGAAFCLPGNHDMKLLRKLRGSDVTISHGLSKTLEQLEGQSGEFVEEVKNFLESLVSHYIFDGGRLAVAHAGIIEKYQGRASARVRDFCLYGDTTGETDEYGFPVRLPWANDYRGRAKVVYGHTPTAEAAFYNNTICIDTGCVFGGKLTAYRYPENEIVQVAAKKEYYPPAKPLAETLETKPEENMGDMLVIEDVLNQKPLSTKYRRSIKIKPENAAAALEIMSRFSVDPHWLIYLPPTMSPCETSKLPDYLEYPSEAFDYYKTRGIEKVVCELKHMGSRAVIVLCRDEETAKRRFGPGDGSSGIIYTRTGRRFFEDAETERAILKKLQCALGASGFWEDFGTGWVCLDAEIMPWSQKAKKLLEEQYAPVGRSGRNGLASAVEMIDKAKKALGGITPGEAQPGQSVDLADLLSQYQKRAEALGLYTEAYRRYCWDVAGIDDYRVAPFHILATENKTWFGENHISQMETIAKYMTKTDPVFIATDHMLVDLSDDGSTASGIRWWERLTGAGGEGMVVKPYEFIAQKNGELLQPAVKCRGREYLRIIYGPEYMLENNLERLKNRSLSSKRSLALNEFALGVEALERFSKNEPLYKVHECVFGILALESEPVDPRL